MRHLFIINPAAGRPESTARLETLLSRLSFPHEVAYTREAGDAQRLAATAARTGGPVRIYACGGDGTLNEVVNGAASFDNAAVTCVPKGTGNDFLKLFGPRFRELFYDLEALAAGPQRAFDLMDCNGKLGLDVVCAGVDARIAAGVHRYKDLRFVSGIGAYLLSLAEQVIFRGLCRPLTIRHPVHLQRQALRRRLHARAGRHAGRRCAGCPGRGGDQPPHFLPPGGQVRPGALPAVPPTYHRLARPVPLLFLPPGDHRGGGRRGHARDPLHRPPLPLENQLFLPCGCRLFPRILALFSPLCERTVNFYEIARNFLKLGVDFLF